MTEEEAFLRAILEEPEDIGLRRIYADWREDQGDADRAEFVRLQCDLDGLADGAPGRAALEAREQALLGAHGEEWAAGLKGLVAYGAFRRGFVEEVGASVGQFLRHGEKLFAAAPVRELHLWGADGAGRLADCPLLGRLRHLDLSGVTLGPKAGAALAASPHLAGLSGLNLACTGVDDATARALADSPHLAELTELYLGGNRLGDDGGWALAGSPYLRLKALDVRDNAIGPVTRAFLARRLGVAALVGWGSGLDW